MSAAERKSLKTDFIVYWSGIKYDLISWFSQCRALREIFSKSYWIKLKSNCTDHFSIDLEPNGRPFVSKSIGSIWFRFDLIRFLCVWMRRYWHLIFFITIFLYYIFLIPPTFQWHPTRFSMTSIITLSLLKPDELCSTNVLNFLSLFQISSFDSFGDTRLTKIDSLRKY